MSSKYFLDMIQNLRQHEEIMLYGNILQTGERELREATEFLRQEYSREAQDFPFTAPEFNEDAAIWSARIVYTAAQLILYRENKEADLAFLLPDYSGIKDASAILSCDLCMRFLPQMIIQLKLIDNEDKLNGILEDKLVKWHYSAIGSALKIEEPEVDAITGNKCLHQLYVNRIIENNDLKLAQHPAFRDLVSASLGNYGTELWKEFKTSASIHE